MDERPETKREKFQRISQQRLPKILHALSLLENLGGSAYESNDRDRQTIVDTLNEGVQKVSGAFGLAQAELKEGPKPEPEKMEPVPEGPSETHKNITVQGGASLKSEVSWIYDAVRRGDKKLALGRLERILASIE